LFIFVTLWQLYNEDVSEFFFFSFSNLMTKDDWKKLGYSDDETVSTSNAE
jgi:hypothetical protein